MYLRTTLPFVLLLLSLTAGAQLDLREDSVRIMEQNNFHFTKKGVEHRLYEYSRYDEEGRLLERDRYMYEPSDTGNVVALHEQIQYNPRNREGEVKTARFPTPSNPKKEATEQKTLFKSYDHDHRFLWRKRMDAEGKMRLETRFVYNNDGLLVQRNETDFSYDHPIKRADKISYNEAGERLTWESTDENEEGKRQVRAEKWSYDAEGRLLRAEGYLNFHWKEADYKYKKGKLQKVTRRMGPRGPSGDINYDYKSIEEYDEQERLVRVREWKFGKKVSNKELSYSHVFPENEHIVEERTEEQDGTVTVLRQKEVEQDGRLRLKQTIENGELHYEERYQYRNNGQLKKYIRKERQGNGDLWKTITTYNEAGLKERRSHFVEKELRREERYRYKYHEAEQK